MASGPRLGEEKGNYTPAHNMVGLFSLNVLSEFSTDAINSGVYGSGTAFI